MFILLHCIGGFYFICNMSILTQLVLFFNEMSSPKKIS